MARELLKPRAPESRPSPSHDEITRRAYQIYLDRGCPQGRDLEHWFEAEQQLTIAQQASSNRTSTRPQAQRRF